MNGIFSNFFRVELKLEKTRVFNYYESHVGSLLIKETLSREWFFHPDDLDMYKKMEL